MGQAAPIVLADNVPTNHTFNPVTTGPTSMLETSEMAIAAAEKQLIAGLSRATSTRPTDRVTQRLNIPFMQTVDGVNSVRSTARVDVTVVVPVDCTAAERLVIAHLYKNMAANAVMMAYITTRDQMY